MGNQNYLWHFILSVLLCTLMGLEGKDTTTATTESHLSVSRSTNNSSSTGPAADSSNGSVAEPDTPTAQHSRLGTTSLSPSAMRMVGAEVRMNSTPTTIMQEGGSLEMSARSSALPTAGTGTTTAPSTGTDTGTASSPPLSSATRSHSSSSSSSSSPGASSAVPPSPQHSSTSSTTGMLSATTSHPPTALVISSPSSTAGTTGNELIENSPAAITASTKPVPSTSGTSSMGSSALLPSPQQSSTSSATGTALAITSHPSTALVLSPSSTAGTAQFPAGTETQGSATPRPVASTSPVSGTIETRPSATVGSSTGTLTPQLSSTALPQGQPTVQVTASSPPTGSNSPSTATASGGSSATTPPGEEEGSTMSQGFRTTAETSHFLPATSPASMMTTVGGEGRTDTARTTTMSERGSLGTSPGSGAGFPAFPTGTGTTAAPESGTASSLSFSSTVTSHSSSSSSPMGSSAVPPSSQQSSTSSTTGMPLAITSHPSTALVTATSPPSSSTAAASAGSSATTPPGEGRSSTMNQGIRTEPSANTSHSLPATSLTTLSTTNLSTSTSVNPSITTTCSAVSVKVQNVTEEEIQLSWSSSSSTGSLYSISVKDGKEINTRTTNETEAVIANLLPGQEYTISVALSSCAGSNPASVTVRTDSGSCFERTEFCLAQSTGCSDLKGTVCSSKQAFSCTVWLKNETFNNTLYNSESKSYKKMSESLKKEVLEAMHAELGNNHSDIFILGFRPGSVIADFLFLLPKEEAMDVGDIQTRLSNVLRSKFGSQSQVQTLSVQSPTDNISSWRVAVIVLGVLLGVALVLILLAILFYIHVRRRSGMDFSTLYTW